MEKGMIDFKTSSKCLHHFLLFTGTLQDMIVDKFHISGEFYYFNRN